MRVTVSCRYCIAFEVMLLFLVNFMITPFWIFCCFFVVAILAICDTENKHSEFTVCANLQFFIHILERAREFAVLLE